MTVCCRICTNTKRAFWPVSETERIDRSRYDGLNTLRTVGASATGTVGQSGGGDVQFQVDSAAGVFSSGSWNHIAIVNSTGRALLYVNGGLTANIEMARNTQLNLGSIGAYMGSSDFWLGSIAQCHVYNLALDADEVTILSQEYN